MKFPKLLQRKDTVPGNEAPEGEAVLGREARPRRRALMGTLQILVVVALILAALILRADRIHPRRSRISP